MLITGFTRALALALLVLSSAAGALMAQQQQPTPAVPFAGAARPQIVTQLPNDARAGGCNAFARDAFAVHIVRPGDTLPALLAGLPEYTPVQVAVANCLDDPSALPVGAALFIPARVEPPPPVDPLALLALARFRVFARCDHAWLGGLGAAPRCPEEPARAVYAAYQPFAGGALVWFSDTALISVLWADDTFSSFTDTYQEGMPQAPIAAPAGQFAPVRGFRLVWEELGGAAGALGWATAAEQGFDSARQPAGRISYTTYVALPFGVAALTELPNSQVGLWAPVTETAGSASR